MRENLVNNINETLNVSEKQLLASKIIEDKSRFYHSEDKGCELQDVVILRKTGVDVYNAKCKFCKTHEVDVCRCGWEIGMHYGTHSRGLSYLGRENQNI